MSRRIETVAIIGRDAAAWIAAAAIQDSVGRTGAGVRVIELPSLLQLADCYSAVPQLMGLHRQLGIDERHMMRACNALPMVAQRFSNWSGSGSPFLHGYDEEPPPSGDLDFTQYWSKGRQGGLRTPFENFSPGAMAAKAGRVPVARAAADEAPLTAGYGYHLDAARYSSFMKQLALHRGVSAKPARIAGVDLDGESIRAVLLADGERVEADLFIDASGSEAALIGRMPGSGFESWRQWLPCDRMIAVSAKRLEPTPAFSQVSAFAGGWFGLYPLADRTAVIAAYDSRLRSDQQMLDDLPVLARLPISGEAVVSELRQGIRERTWIGNCVCVGESAIALEPLDALQLHVAHSCISHLMAYFPVESGAFPEAATYDRAIRSLAANMRDFQLAHYKLNRRFDDPFWDRCRDAPCPESLSSRIDLFAARGHVVLYDNETFAGQNWASLFIGHGLVPETYDPRVDLLPEQDLIAKVHRRLQDIVALVGSMPSVDEYLADDAPQGRPELVHGG